jgi:hypothetical protein
LGSVVSVKVHPNTSLVSGEVIFCKVYALLGIPCHFFTDSG